MVKAARPLFPDHEVRLTSGIDAHHELVRFSWQVVGPDGSVPVAGIDIGVEATVEANSAEAGVVTLRVDGRPVPIGRPAAEQLLVVPH